jgi:hypothetical protein
LGVRALKLHLGVLLCRRVAEDSIKNYQLWNHRRKIALALGPAAAAEAELQFCTGIGCLHRSPFSKQSFFKAAGAFQQPDMQCPCCVGTLVSSLLHSSSAT